MAQDDIDLVQANQLEQERAMIHQLYQSRNITSTIVRMQTEPTTNWIDMPVIYGATRIDSIHNDLFVKFPTWQHAAEFHAYAHERQLTDNRINDVVPMLLGAPVTHETYVDALKARYTTANRDVTMSTFIVELE